MFVYIYRLFIFLTTAEEDQYFQFKVDTEDSYNVTIDKMNMVHFFYLYYWDKDGIKRNLDYNKETKRYIRIGFGQGKNNYTKENEADYHSTSFFEAVDCTDEHF